jgi:hypothetical protein
MLEKLQNQEMQQLTLEITETKKEDRLNYSEETALKNKLEAIDINALTPMEALVQLHELQK